MNLTSCDNCGIVLDKDKITFPDDCWDEDGCVKEDKATWDDSREKYVPFVKCPVCKEKILE